MVIIEAMAMGLPVLATPVGIAPEVIRQPACGLISPGSDAAALERGLRELLELHPSWAEIGVAARQRVAGFTAERMARRYLELYERWLSGAGPPASRP